MSDLYVPNWDLRIGRTESPIERAFLHAFCDLAVEDGFGVAKYSVAPAFVIIIETSKWLGPYRADFVITYHYFGLKTRLVIECDGHEFHRRDKVQARKESARDRWLTAQGYKVLRFTGSEINSSPVSAAAEVLNVIRDFQSWASWWLYKAAKKNAVRKQQLRRAS